MSKTISDKNSLVVAMRAYNKLPNDLKILTYKKSTIKTEALQIVTLIATLRIASRLINF